MERCLLSVLTCHLPDRKVELDRLIAKLGPQMTPKTEHLINTDDAPTGLKRNRLMEKAKGKYVSFVDDDDIVSDDYVIEILKAIGNNPDCVGIVGIITVNGQNPWQFRHSITVNRWCKDKANKIYFRTPNHLNALRRDIALSAGFNSTLTWGEDRDFSERLKGRLKTETFIEKPIYYYLSKG